MNNRSAIIALHAKLDSVLKFSRPQYEDDEPSGAAGKIAGGAAAAGLGAAGLYTAGAHKMGWGGDLIGKAKLDYGSRELTTPLREIGKTMKAGAGSIVDYTKSTASKAGPAITGLLEKLKGLKKFSRQGAVIELKAKLDSVIQLDQRTALFTGLPEDWERRGESTVRVDRLQKNKPVFSRKVYDSPVSIPSSIAARPVVHDDKEGVTSYDDMSPSRIRRLKAIATAGLTGAAGYVAGKHGSAILGKLKNVIKR